MNVFHQAAAAGFAFVVGASVGSFLNVCVWRLPRRESVSHPPSRCPSCGATILAIDNIPIVSWLFLRGKCRSCAWPIPARYPLVEAGVGFLFGLFMLIELNGNDPFEGRLIECVSRLTNQSLIAAIVVTSAMIERDAARTLGRKTPEKGLVDSTIGLTTALGLALCLFVVFVLASDLVGALLVLCLSATFLVRWNRSARRIRRVG